MDTQSANLLHCMKNYQHTSICLQHEPNGIHMHQSIFLATDENNIVKESFESYCVISQFGNVLLATFVINRVLVKIIYQAHEKKADNCVRSRKANIFARKANIFVIFFVGIGAFILFCVPSIAYPQKAIAARPGECISSTTTTTTVESDGTISRARPSTSSSVLRLNPSLTARAGDQIVPANQAPRDDLLRVTRVANNLRGVNILAYRDIDGRVAFLIPTRFRSSRTSVDVQRHNADLASLCPAWMALDRTQTENSLAVPVGGFYETAISLSLFFLDRHYVPLPLERGEMDIDVIGVRAFYADPARLWTLLDTGGDEHLNLVQTIMDENQQNQFRHAIGRFINPAIEDDTQEIEEPTLRNRIGGLLKGIWRFIATHRTVIITNLVLVFRDVQTQRAVQQNQQAIQEQQQIVEQNRRNIRILQTANRQNRLQRSEQETTRHSS